MSILTKVSATAVFFLTAASVPAAVIAVGPNDFGPFATRLNFDELADQSPIGSTYSALGVEFQNARVDAGMFPVSPPNLIVAANLAAPVTILFPTGVFRVGIQIDRDGFTTERQPQIQAFDDQGNLLGTLLFIQGPDFQGFQATTGSISRIVLGSCFGTLTCDPLWYSDSYDNLVFALTPGSDVPEPSTIAGGALGALLLLVAHRRRRRQQPPVA